MKKGAYPGSERGELGRKMDIFTKYLKDMKIKTCI